jgi:hypothetical protein
MQAMDRYSQEEDFSMHKFIPSLKSGKAHDAEDRSFSVDFKKNEKYPCTNSAKLLHHY